MLRRLAAFLALSVLGPIAAEAQAGKSYPSLARRSAETRERTVPAAPQVQPAPVDQALATQVEGLAKQAANGDSAFQQLVIKGRATVSAAAGSTPLSESWVTAQMAISALDSARYDSVAALAGLDTLYVERQDGGDIARSQTDLATITPARTRALSLVDGQNDTLDSLRNALRQP